MPSFSFANDTHTHTYRVSSSSSPAAPVMPRMVKDQFRLWTSMSSVWRASALATFLTGVARDGSPVLLTSFSLRLKNSKESPISDTWVLSAEMTWILFHTFKAVYNGLDLLPDRLSYVNKRFFLQLAVEDLAHVLLGGVHSGYSHTTVNTGCTSTTAHMMERGVRIRGKPVLEVDSLWNNFNAGCMQSWIPCVVIHTRDTIHI